MTDPATEGEWSRFHSAWTDGFIAWRHTSGAVVWRLDRADDRYDATWGYSSDDVQPCHGDRHDVRRPFPSREPDILIAKRLALALARDTPDYIVNAYRAAIKLPARGTTGDLEHALEQLVYQHVTCGVWVEGLVLTIHSGWRARVLQLAMWAIEASGHTVIRLPDRGEK